VTSDDYVTSGEAADDERRARLGRRDHGPRYDDDLAIFTLAHIERALRARPGDPVFTVEDIRAVYQHAFSAGNTKGWHQGMHSQVEIARADARLSPDFHDGDGDPSDYSDDPNWRPRRMRPHPPEAAGS
jgi:hypothetical protein